MNKRIHVSKDIGDTPVSSAGQLYQTRPFHNEFQNEKDANGQPANLTQPQADYKTGGWDLTKQPIQYSQPPSSLQAKLTVGQSKRNDAQNTGREVQNDVQVQTALLHQTGGAISSCSSVSIQETHAPAQIQAKFLIGGVEVPDVNAWIEQYIPEDRPDMALVVRGWATSSKDNDCRDDADAYQKAEKEASNAVERENQTVADSIKAGAPQQVDYASVPMWSAWYFSGLEYQNNQTGGWHRNKDGWLPGEATVQGDPTRYVEFRRPGAVGKKDVSKMERCVFDLLDKHCWPNAHYDAGYIEIINVPTSVTNKLLKEACSMTGITAEVKKMSKEEKTGKTARQLIEAALARL